MGTLLGRDDAAAARAPAEAEAGMVGSSAVEFARVTAEMAAEAEAAGGVRKPRVRTACLRVVLLPAATATATARTTSLSVAVTGGDLAREVKVDFGEDWEGADNWLDATVLHGKRAIHRQSGFGPPSQLRLVFAGKQLDDGTAWRDTGCEWCQTLHAVARAPGPPQGESGGVVPKGRESEFGFCVSVGRHGGAAAADAEAQARLWVPLGVREFEGCSVAALRDRAVRALEAAAREGSDGGAGDDVGDAAAWVLCDASGASLAAAAAGSAGSGEAAPCLLCDAGVAWGDELRLRRAGGTV